MYVVHQLERSYGPFKTQAMAEAFAGRCGGVVFVLQEPKDNRTIEYVYDSVDFVNHQGGRYHLIRAMNEGFIIIANGSRLRWDNQVWPVNTKVQAILDFYHFTLVEANRE